MNLGPDMAEARPSVCLNESPAMDVLDLRVQIAEGFEKLDGRIDRIEFTQTRNMLATVFWAVSVIMAVSDTELGPFVKVMIALGLAFAGLLGWHLIHARKEKQSSRSIR